MLELGSPDLGTILCLGAHGDDLEIGAGATVLRLARDHPGLRIVWVVLAGAGRRGDEAAASAARLFGAGRAEIVLGSFHDNRFPENWGAIKDMFETLKAIAPDLIFTHYGQDRHQDHRVVSDLTWNAFRDHMILEYEIPKWDGGLGSPNFYMSASAADTDKKLAILQECFVSQRDKDWFDNETFRGLMRLRGVECRAPDRLAEAFYAKKLLWGRDSFPTTDE